MNLLLGVAALVGLLLSLLVHASALFGVDVSARFPQVWLLHVGAFALSLAAGYSSRTTIGPRLGRSELRAAFPRWVLVLGAVLFAYAILNFALFVFVSEGGTVDDRGGALVLQRHGELIRPLSRSEYVAFRANEIRGFSGHWLLFYFLPMAYFLFRTSEED